MKKHLICNLNSVNILVLTMTNFFKTKYRIVTDCYRGYQAQFKYWWWPLWFQCYGVNSRDTIDGARLVIDKHNNQYNVKSKLVEQYDPSN